MPSSVRPVAAASIAQVHKSKVRHADGTLKPVAVKVLRPGIEQRFQAISNSTSSPRA